MPIRAPATERLTTPLRTTFDVALEAKGLTSIRDAARIMKMAPSHLSRLLNGARGLDVSYSTVAAVAEFVGQPAEAVAELIKAGVRLHARHLLAQVTRGKKLSQAVLDARAIVAEEEQEQAAKLEAPPPSSILPPRRLLPR